MNKYTKALYDRFMKMIGEQVSEGVPVEYQEYLSHPMDAQQMPTIEHRRGRKRPDFVEKDLEGWELLG